MPNQLLAANADVIAYQMEEYKNSYLVVNFSLFEHFSVQELRGIFTILCIALAGKTTRQMPFVFHHFIMAAIPHVKCDVGSVLENSTWFSSNNGDNGRNGKYEWFNDCRNACFSQTKWLYCHKHIYNKINLLLAKIA